MQFTFASVAAVSFLVVSSAVAVASPCGDKIAAVEKKLNETGAASQGAASKEANARTVKSRQVIEDARNADARGDAKGCDSTLEKALRETGSAQQ